MAADPRARTFPRWLSTLLLGAILLTLAFMVWSLLSSQRRVSAEHRRNFHVLTVLAEGIAGWPPNLATMARANLMLSQLLAPEPSQALKGWQARTDLFNPRLGRVRINYAIVGQQENCPSGAPNAQFSQNGGMTITDQLSLSDILLYDLKRAGQMQASTPIEGGHRVIDLLNTHLKPMKVGLKNGKDSWLKTARLCFSTKIALGEFIELGTTSTPMVALLILDEKKRIVAQLGSERLPVSDQKEIAASRPISQSLVNMIFRTEGKSGAIEKAPADQDDNVENLGPYPVDIAGSAYTAYARPFTISDSTGVPKRFLAVGLLPRRAMGKDIGELPPTTVTGFALALGFLLAMWPVVKLRLIGGGEAMGRLEVWAVGFGLVAATALATIAIRFAHDVMQARSAASSARQVVARNMSKEFGTELRRSVDAARPYLGLVWDPQRGRDQRPDLDVSPIEVADLHPGQAPARPPPQARLTCPKSNSGHLSALPALESFFVADAEGEQLPKTSILVWRRCAGGRPTVGGRPYFRQATAGRLLDSHATPLNGKSEEAWMQRDGIDWTLSGRYAISQVRSQADGISKTIIAFEAQGKSDRELVGKDDPAAATSVTVLPALVAPALPPGLEYMVINAADPDWPVIFHSDPSRVDVEKLRREIASRAAEDAVERLMPSPSQGEPLPPPPPEPKTPPAPKTSPGHEQEPSCRPEEANPTVCFRGLYDGRSRLFAGRALPGTPWVLLVHADVGQADLPATETTQKALEYLFIVAVVVGLLILLRQYALRTPGRPLLARWASVLHQRFASGRNNADTVRRSFAPAALLLLAACAIVADSLGAPLPVTLLPAILAALITFLGLLPIGRRIFDPRVETVGVKRHLNATLIALLLLSGTVPAWTIYSDASRFIADRQASRNMAVLSESLDRAFLGQREVLTSFDPTLRGVVQQDLIHEMCPSNPLLKPKNVPENIFVDLHCPGAAHKLVSNSWIENGARMTGDAFAPAYAACDEKETCRDSTKSMMLKVTPKAPLGPFSWFLLGMLVLVLAMLLWFAMNSVLRGLFGTGLPLPVTFPRLPQRGDGDVEMRRDNWTMIVRPPLALSRSLVTRGIEINVASGRERFLAAPATQEDADQTPIVLTNLEMTMRSPEGRQSALAVIEAVAAWHDRLRAESKPRPPLVILVELAPLDRLLQAYEREAEAAEKAGEARPMRSQEKMRWSRLLERFHTYFFEATRHVDPLGPDSPAAAWTAVEEVAFLPEQAIDALLEHPPEPPEPPPGRPYRLTATEYAAAYTEPVHKWAYDLHAPSPEAVVDYLRSMLVEHYQFIWTISSWAERLAMHHLARGRLMNVETAQAINSLARRGIVVLDPLPRLMNQSFARFVLHTEKPTLVRQWRNSLGAGVWQSARWPLAAMIGLGILGIVLLLINAGEPPEALLPLMIAAGPALLQTLGVMRR